MSDAEDTVLSDTAKKKDNRTRTGLCDVDVLTQISAHVNIKVHAIVRVVDQVAICDFDERAEVVLLPVRVKDVAGNLEEEGNKIKLLIFAI